jgi:NADH-quinone oxidoreductase subunit M
MVQMISHGFVSGAMFSCIGVLYDRMHSADRRLRRRGQRDAVVRRVRDAVLHGQRGLPGTSGFVGEFMVILPRSSAIRWIAWARPPR